jgi:hypothetical protein
MKINLSSAGLLTLLFTFYTPLIAQTGEWTDLMDQGLEGFNPIGGANWVIIDRVISASSGESNGYLVTPDAYDDFELLVEFYASKAQNSGIFIRCQDPQDVTAENCYEVNIYDFRTDQTYRTGGIVGLAPPLATVSAGEQWNTYLIRAEGDRLYVVLNGKVTVDTTDSELESGYIGLQWGSGILSFRNVRIREL